MITSKISSIFNSKEVLAVYPHGSQVYGTATKNSDFDYIVIVEDSAYTQESFFIDNCDLHIFTKSEWIKKSEENDIDFCECFFLPKSQKIKEEFVPTFVIDKKKLRANFSRKASNSFVKCKKKLEVKEDFSPYIGKKSLWHSFRILMFGIQILESGEITDYSCANFLYNEIVNSDHIDWTFFKKKYQQLYKHYKSEFRKFD